MPWRANSPLRKNGIRHSATKLTGATAGRRATAERGRPARAGYWPAYLEFHAHAHAMAVVGRMIERGKRDGSLHDRLRTTDEARVVIGLAHLIAHMKFAGNDARTIARTVRSLVDGYLTRPPGAG
jgi:hypothetical protein